MTHDVNIQTYLRDQGYLDIIGQGIDRSVRALDNPADVVSDELRGGSLTTRFLSGLLVAGAGFSVLPSGAASAADIPRVEVAYSVGTSSIVTTPAVTRTADVSLDVPEIQVQQGFSFGGSDERVVGDAYTIPITDLATPQADVGSMVPVSMNTQTSSYSNPWGGLKNAISAVTPDFVKNAASELTGSHPKQDKSSSLYGRQNNNNGQVSVKNFMGVDTSQAPALPVQPAEASPRHANIKPAAARHKSPNHQPSNVRYVHLRDGGEIKNMLLNEHGGKTGKLHPSELETIGRQWDNHRLYPDAAISFREMAKAFERDMGEPLQITDSYRSYAQQVDLKLRKPSLGAVPGTSNHGLGLATDLASNVDNPASKEHKWMDKNSARFGWVNPGWARKKNGKFEPWHDEYVGNVTLTIDPEATKQFIAKPMPKVPDVIIPSMVFGSASPNLAERDIEFAAPSTDAFPSTPTPDSSFTISAANFFNQAPPIEEFTVPVQGDPTPSVSDPTMPSPTPPTETTPPTTQTPPVDTPPVTPTPPRRRTHSPPHPAQSPPGVSTPPVASLPGAPIASTPPTETTPPTTQTPPVDTPPAQSDTPIILEANFFNEAPPTEEATIPIQGNPTPPPTPSSQDSSINLSPGDSTSGDTSQTPDTPSPIPEQPPTSIPNMEGRSETPSTSSDDPGYQRALYAMHWYDHAGGLTPIAAAGMVGNEIEESGVNPNRKQKHGPAKGIVQWETRYNGLLEFAAQQGLDPLALKTQLQFSHKELNSNYKPTKKAINHAKSPEEAAVIVQDTYEKPDPNNIPDTRHTDVRVNAAKSIYKLYMQIPNN